MKFEEAQESLVDEKLPSRKETGSNNRNFSA